MMFPNNAFSPPPPLLATVPTPVSRAPDATDGKRSLHADYDLQPVAVHSLARYMAASEEGERFHVH
jgi:hypothetical protein